MLGADERTLRRAIRDGTVRGERPSPRRLELAAGEQQYLQEYWGLLSTLRGALRTEPRVRLAVLYGSMARGDEAHESDVDLMVNWSDSADPLAGLALAARLEAAVGREVGVVDLDRVREHSSLLLEQALIEGRVVIDRDRIWNQVLADRDRISRRARQQYRREMLAARVAIADFLGEN